MHIINVCNANKKKNFEAKKSLIIINENALINLL